MKTIGYGKKGQSDDKSGYFFIAYSGVVWRYGKTDLSIYSKIRQKKEENQA